MADVIREEDIERFVGLAKKLIDKNRYSPIEIIKNMSCNQPEKTSSIHKSWR